MVATAVMLGSGAVGAAVVAAAPAQAADLGTFTWNGTSFTSVAVTGEVNDTFTLVNTGVATGSLQNDTGAARQGSTDCTVVGGSPSCNSPGGSTTVFTVTQTGRLGVHGMVSLLGYITITSASSASAPGAIIQQFVRPASGSCDAAQPPGLDRSGVAAGGWGESWAQWANGGWGDRVCTRMLEYANGWRIAS